MTGRQVPNKVTVLEDGTVHISVREAARILGVSESSVYGYLARGRLRERRIGERIMLNEQEVRAFQGQLSDRACNKTPFWQMLPGPEPLYLMTIIVPVRPGCGALLDQKLAEFHACQKHQVVGACARAISRSLSAPERLTILLFWREEVLPSRQQREQELAALAADLFEVCAWEMALVTQGQTFGRVG